VWRNNHSWLLNYCEACRDVWSFSIPAMYNYRFNVDADNETAAILGFVFFDVPLANDGGL
jgi:hypothetical protein